MDLKPSVKPRRPPVPVKIVIAGGFGVGKTTAVSSISEIRPLTTEAAITSVAAQIDRTGEVPAKVATTVALDFGCITLDDSLKLYLFGTPGQDRFGFMWHDLAHGALGALEVGLPFVVAVNLFDGELIRDLGDLRWALAVDAGIPLITFDARDRISVRDALLAVLRHTRSRIER
ncbi:MAG: ATP-binding protein [Actinobacteria bacterium 13_1_20CM_3_71_11]|nr:MAG: ATP-binding protein [Actinobacteria bacterium 13_1_20CM_3_71_11]